MQRLKQKKVSDLTKRRHTTLVLYLVVPRFSFCQILDQMSAIVAIRKKCEISNLLFSMTLNDVVVAPNGRKAIASF